MQLTSHFSLEELTHSDTAVRLSIDNAPTPEILANLKMLADDLEVVRALLGAPLHINSGYRSPELNKHIPGSSSTSAHMSGFAADFTCPGYGTPLEIAQLLAANLTYFDQCIAEGMWVHISFDPKNRKQAMTAKFFNGQPHYTQGI